MLPDAGRYTAALDGDVGSVAVEEFIPDLRRHLFRRLTDLNQLRSSSHLGSKLATIIRN